MAALAPGILTYETEADGEVFVAVDEGVLVKTGADVLVSVRHAIGGTDLGQLQRRSQAGVSDAGSNRSRASLGDGEAGKRLSCAASRSFNMSDEPNNPANDRRFAGKVGAEGSAQAQGAAGSAGRLVRAGHVGTDRLVGGGADAARRGARLWLDRRHPGRHSWTLALLFAGLCIGCVNAWHWVAKEDKAMRKKRRMNDE